MSNVEQNNKKKKEFTELHKYLFTRQSSKFPGGKITHTRIGNKELGIHGGAYCISKKEDISIFNTLYYDKVIKKGCAEYLTELQDRDNGGPILVDLDFRFKDVEERQHDENHISDIVELYIEQIGKLCKITEEVKTFRVFIFEKDKMNILDKASQTNEFTAKDGIHIIIGLRMKHDMQLLLRTMVCETLNDVLDDLKPALVNEIEDIVDESINSGKTGWQLYGSKKPGGKAYKLTGIYKIVYQDNDNEYIIEANASKEEIEKFKKKPKILKIFSIRNNPIYKEVEISEQMNETWKKIKEQEEQKLNNQKVKYVSTEEQDSQFEIYMENNSIEKIGSEEELDKVINAFIFDSGKQELINAHNYTMLLGKDYYEPFDKWLKVGMALQHTNDKLILSWIKFSSKSDKFNWDDCGSNIPNRWDHFKKNKDNLVTLGSIKFWAEKSNPEEYKKIRQENINQYIKQTLFGKGTEYDLARLAHLIYKDKFACVQMKNNGEWWEYGKKSKYYSNIWCENDSGTTLRREISRTLSSLYIEKEREAISTMRYFQQECTESDNVKVIERLTNESAIFNQIAIQLRRTTHKQNIMKECKDEFRDEKLLEKLDENPYTLGCNNGIYDFKGNPYEVKELHNNKYKIIIKYKGSFRNGSPEDYISKTTRLDYIRIDKNNEEHQEKVKEIERFMSELFVDKNLRRYMWEHLASGTIGTNSNQTFNIYNGNGSNGKSMLVSLMKKVLGDYGNIAVPITLITGNRTNIGCASPEIADLKGIRYACMQESTKGDKINDGVMKQLTGKDPLTGRKLYHDPITFNPQFSLVCCLNNMPTVSSNDGGTWRRIRKVDFDSKFVDTGAGQKISDVKADKQFIMDKYLEEKFESWAPYMLSMLIDIAQERMGLVDDCEKVKEASNAYRNKEDYLSQFFLDKVIQTNNEKDRVLKSTMKLEFQKWWHENKTTKCPPMSDLIVFLDKEYEKKYNQGLNMKFYKGWKIEYDHYEDEEIDNEA